MTTSSAGGPAPRHILVAEDSQVQAKKLLYLLQSYGFRVSWADNGQRALEVARNELPDLVISDVMMPGLGGYELCSAIKADPAMRELPVLLLTSLSDPHDIIRGLQSGADNFVTKPYDEEHLLSRVQYLLASRALRSRNSSGMVLEIVFRGETFAISSERSQILDLLLSVFEAAVQKAEDLQAAEQRLQALNAGLEQQVQERTAALTAEVAERARSEARVRHLNRVLGAVHDVSQLIAQLTERGELLARTCQILVEAGSCRGAALVLRGPDDSVLEAEAAGTGEAPREAAAMRAAGRLSDRCRAALAGLGPEPASERSAANDAATALLPLRHGETAYGVLLVTVGADDGLIAEELDLFGQVAGDLGFALYSLELDEARQRAEQDRAVLETQLRQQQKLESIGTLAGGVAHEINNPIMGVQNYAQLILDGLPAGSEEATFAQEILHETERIATIVRNLLQFARHEKQSHSPALMSDIIDGTLSLVRTILRHDQITLEVEVPADLPPLKCRSQQLQQVVMNLLTNARDALNERFEGYHEEKRIRLSCREIALDGEAGLRLTVEDHGAGIPAEVGARIMDPFFTTKGREQGTGLGLAVSHGIIADHRGRLWYETELGQGTRFHVDLPTDNGWEL